MGKVFFVVECLLPRCNAWYGARLLHWRRWEMERQVFATFDFKSTADIELGFKKGQSITVTKERRSPHRTESTRSKKRRKRRKKTLAARCVGAPLTDVFSSAIVDPSGWWV